MHLVLSQGWNPLNLPKTPHQQPRLLSPSHSQPSDQDHPKAERQPGARIRSPRPHERSLQLSSSSTSQPRFVATSAIGASHITKFRPSFTIKSTSRIPCICNHSIDCLTKSSFFHDQVIRVSLLRRRDHHHRRKDCILHRYGSHCWRRLFRLELSFFLHLLFSIATEPTAPIED